MDFKSVIQCLENKKFDELNNFKLPQYFRSTETRSDDEIQLLLKIIKVYTSDSPVEVEIVCLKTLINSCQCAYSEKHDENNRINSHFPYMEAIEHSIKKVMEYSKKSSVSGDDKIRLILNLKFICNFLIMLCQTKTHPSYEKVPDCVKTEDFKNQIINLIKHDCEEIATIACIFCHNALVELIEDYFNTDELVKLYTNFIFVYTKIGCDTAKAGILQIIKIPTIFELTYESSCLNEKKVLIEILTKYIDEHTEFDLPDNIVSHLVTSFNKISDKVTLTSNIKNLKTEEPEELSMLLEIMLHTTSNNSELLCILQKKKSFLINCVCLLKMLHLMGKEPNSCFAPADYTKERIMALKANPNDKKDAFKDYGDINSLVYGFKSRLIRMIANLVNENTDNQNIVRELEGLSVILDCCTFDAKNPLIKECAIFAIRNLCKNNEENQKQIQAMKKLESDSTGILEEMGLTLQDNDTGTSIRIAPLTKK